MSTIRWTAGAASRLRFAFLAVSAAIIASGMTACRTAAGAGSGESRDTAPQCDAEAPAILRISNSSGRVLDVYVARAEAQPQFMRQVSPGTSSATVPGPADMGVRYDIIDPNARQLLASVTWLRRTAREVTKGVIVELACSTNAPPGGGTGAESGYP